MLPLLLTPLALAAPLAPCDRTYSTTELLDALDSAEGNFRKMDGEGFRFSEAAVAIRLICITEPLVPDVLARVYLVEALKAVLDKDDAHLATALAAMASSNPGYQIPLSLVPEGHPVRKAMTPASLLIREPVVAPLAVLDVGWIEVDGVHRAEAPVNRDVVLQRFGPDGQVVETQYVRAGESLERWSAGKKGKARLEVAAEAPPVPSVSPVPSRPPVAHRRLVSVRGSLDLMGGAYGSSELSPSSPPGFAGPAGRVAIGVEVGAGRLGGFAEAGWLGLVALPTASGSSGGAHSLVVAAGPQLRFGAVTLEAGPTWTLGAVHLDGLDCSAADCGEAASTGTGSVDGLVLAGGGVLTGDVRLGGPDSLLAIELTGSAVTDLARTAYWGGAGLRLGKRWVAN